MPGRMSGRDVPVPTAWAEFITLADAGPIAVVQWRSSGTVPTARWPGRQLAG